MRKIQEITLSANTTVSEPLHSTRHRASTTRRVGRNLSPITVREVKPKAARNIRQNRRRTPTLRLRQRNISFAARLVLRPYAPLAGLSDLRHMLLTATRRIPRHAAISISRTIRQAQRASSKTRDHATDSARHKPHHRLNTVDKALNDSFTGVEKPPPGISEYLLHLAGEFLHRLNSIGELLLRVVHELLQLRDNIGDSIRNLRLDILPSLGNSILNSIPHRGNHVLEQAPLGSHPPMNA